MYVNAFRQHKALALTLNDTKIAVNTLNQMTNVVVGIIVVCSLASYSGNNYNTFLCLPKFTASPGSFHIGNTLKTFFETNI